MQINNPTIAQLLQRAFQLQGRVRVSLEESVIATVSLGDLSEGSPPPITRHVSTAFSIASASAEEAIWRLEIPGNVIAVITNFSVEAVVGSTAIQVFFGSSFSGGDLPSLSTPVFTDGRLLQKNEFPAGVCSFGTKAGGLVVFDWQGFVFGTPDQPANGFLPKRWVAGSGIEDQFGFIEFCSVRNNSKVDVTVEWDEFQIF